jgi:predicted outer membrane protein
VKDATIYAHARLSLWDGMHLLTPQVTHYSKAGEELKAAAKEAGFPAPPLLRQDQLVFDRFNGMGRSSFDKAYMAEMVERQNEAVRLFQGE